MIDFTKVTNIVQEFAPQIFVDVVTKRAHFLNHLMKKPPSSPQGPRWQVKVTGHSAATAYAEGTPAPAASEFVAAKASLAWGQYHETIQLGGLSRDVLAAGNETYIANYIREQITDAMITIASTVNTDAMGAAVTNGITGLTGGIDDTGTYANINRSTYANFGTYVNDNSGTPRAVTIALMTATHNYLVDTIGGDYTEIWCGSAQADALLALTSGLGTVAPRLVINNGDTEARAVIGYGGRGVMEPNGYYRGRPVYAIPGYTTGRIDLVNADTIWFEVLKDITVDRLAKTSDAEDYYITYKLQLVVSDPRKGCASLQDLS